MVFLNYNNQITSMAVNLFLEGFIIINLNHKSFYCVPTATSLLIVNNLQKTEDLPVSSSEMSHETGHNSRLIKLICILLSLTELTNLPEPDFGSNKRMSFSTIRKRKICFFTAVCAWH